MEPKTQFPVVSVHDFKTNLSRYIRLLRRREAKGIVVRRYKKQIVMLVAINLPEAAPEKNLDLVHQLLRSGRTPDKKLANELLERPAPRS